MVSNVLTSWRCNKPGSQQARRRRGATSSTLWWTSCCYDPLGPTRDHEEDTAHNRSEANEQIQRKLSQHALKPFICRFLGLPARTSFLAAWWVCSAASPLGCCLCGRPPGRQQLHFQRWRREVADAHGRPALPCHGGGRGKEILPKSSVCECKGANAFTTVLSEHDYIWHSMFFLPSLKKATASISLSRARGATSVVWTIRETIPARPKKRYMVECCQFITSSQCFSAALYNWSLGPSANCSAKIPGVHSTCCLFTLSWAENCPCQ